MEYYNQKSEATSCWIAVKDLDPRGRRLVADGMHLGSYEIKELTMFIDRITSAKVLEGTLAPVNEKLVQDMKENPGLYSPVFSEMTNLRILDYLSECSKLDQSPYETEFVLVDHLDDDILNEGSLELTPEQFSQLVKGFEKDSKRTAQYYFLKRKQFGMNLISLHTSRGKYILAYQPLRLDVQNRRLSAVGDCVICSTFTVNGHVQNIRQYLDAEDLPLLDDVKHNAEEIREAITSANPNIRVDDMPYLIEVGRDSPLDLDAEYGGILRMYDERKVTVPIQAFFGELTAHSRRTKSYPFALINKRINLDQLLAMNHALRYPVSYVQGPPGTGKTMTIVNTILTAFFNNRTVLFASFNNHPIDEVVSKLQNIRVKGHTIPFPVLRLGSNETALASLKAVSALLEKIRTTDIPEQKLDANRAMRTEQAKNLTRFLEQYENRLDLLERKDAIAQLLKTNHQMNFSLQIETQQLPEIDKELQKTGSFTVEEALSYIDTDFDSLLYWFWYTSVRYLKRLYEPKNEDLLAILETDNEETMIREFNKYISEPDNLRKLLRIFPVIATTCISSHKLSLPEPFFDMVILDEASQCNTAVSLVPIIRGNNLVLVGDPQQLQPVIQLNPGVSHQLRNKYGVTEEYDYCSGSIYKTMLACDAVSDEVLLSHHYRCDPKIIGFSNRKYYNSKLKMNGEQKSEHPLVFINIEENTSSRKNTAPKEAEEIIHYLQSVPDKRVGIITPFVNQKELIQSELERHNIRNVDCGTVHAFQGDEKDIILFSLAVTGSTKEKTYQWLKNNRELINVSTSRAREQLLVFSSEDEILRLHSPNEPDDLYDLVQYVKTAGDYQVAQYPAASRALGIRPYSTETEEAFLSTLSHALDNAFTDGRRYVVHKEVMISQVFLGNVSYDDYFYKGRFDFVVYRRSDRQELPVLAIELDGKEHQEESVVMARDRKKEQICRDHGFELIRVDNTYARRYHYIKDILIRYFQTA